MNKIKNENKILIMLALFSISIGLWGNFRQLWLQDNNFLPTQISNIISIGTFASVIGIIIVSKFIHLSKLKRFIGIAIILKFINSVVLYFLNSTGYYFLINISIVIDIVMEYVVITSIYPLITTIIKNNTIYSKRKLTEYLFRDVGILIGGIFIGKTIFNTYINYNLCLMISNIFLLLSIGIIYSIKNINCEEKVNEKFSILKYIVKNRMLKIYLIYSFMAATALSTGLGLKMLTLTNYYNFSDSFATNYLLVFGLISDILGIVILKWLTPKNDYITITIKFGIRFLAYTIAFLSNNMIITLVAITWSLLIGPAYENVCDGPYINSIENKYQLQFANIRYIIRFLGEAVGVFFCGIMFEIGLRYMFGLSALFMIFQLALAYWLIYIRNNQITRIICNKKPNIDYKERKCAYAIIEDENGNIAITNDGKYFFFGGGTEKNETALETLEREILEETGYTIKDIKLFQNIISYEYNSSRGNLKIIATMFIAKLDKKVKEPIEKDHPILWGKPDEFIEKMYHKYQRVILKEYNEMKKVEKEL